MGFFDSITEITGGDLLGAGAQIVGGIMGNHAKSSANAANLAFAQQQFQYQKDYARNRLQWAVEDAKKAGLHPMVAAGLSPASFSPVSVSSSPMETDWIGEAGQSLSYAASKAMDRKQQAEAFDFTKKLNQAQLDGVELDNELKVMQILSMVSGLQTSGPSAPSLDGLVEGGFDGQPDSLVKPEPMTTTPHTQPGKEPGSNPTAGWLTNSDGSVVKVQSREAKNRLEEDVVGTILWNIDNRLVPHVKSMFGIDISEDAPPVELLPKGAAGWMYNGAGEWLPIDADGKPLNPRFLDRLINGAKSPRMRKFFEGLSKVTY